MVWVREGSTRAYILRRSSKGSERKGKDCSISGWSRDVNCFVLARPTPFPGLVSRKKACPDKVPDCEVELGCAIMSGISMPRQLVFALGLEGRDWYMTLSEKKGDCTLEGRHLGVDLSLPANLNYVAAWR